MSKINIIIMRDRGQSHSFHLSPTTFKIVLSLLVVVPVLLVFTIWFGLSTYSKYVAILEETASLKQSIEHNKQTVTRLANLERFLQKYSPDMLGLLVPADNMDAGNLPVINGDKDALMDELAESLTGSNMSFDIIENGEKEDSPETKNLENTDADKKKAEQKTLIAENVKTEAEKKAEAEMPAEQAPSEQAPAGNTEQIAVNEQGKENTAPVQEVSITQQLNSGYLEIENFHAKLTAQHVDINYQLINLGKKVQIEGRQKYYLSSQIDGKFALQELSNATNSTFRIRHLKNVNSSASVAGMKIGEKAQLVVDVILDEQVVFRQFYPLAR